MESKTKFAQKAQIRHRLNSAVFWTLQVLMLFEANGFLDASDISAHNSSL